jgi:hypothetical protein
MGAVSFLQQSVSDRAGISMIGIGILDMASSRVGTSFLTERIVTTGVVPLSSITYRV